MGNRLNAHVPWLTLMILIIIESSLTGFHLPPIGLRIEDKIVHFLVFGILGWLLIRGLTMERKSWINQNAFIITILIGALFALSDELHQSFVPGRDISMGDLLADVLGISFFVVYFYLKQKHIKNKIAMH